MKKLGWKDLWIYYSWAGIIICSLIISSLMSCSPRVDNPIAAGKANDYFFPYDVVIEKEIHERTGEKLEIEIITTQSSDTFSPKEIEWIRKVSDGWSQAIYAEADYEVYKVNPNGSNTDTKIHLPNFDSIIIEEGTLINGMRLYIYKYHGEGESLASYSYSYSKNDGGVIPFAAVLYINSAYVETEWEYSAVTAHEIGHILGIGIEKSLWGSPSDKSYSCFFITPWMKHIANSYGNYFYQDSCLPNLSETDLIVQDIMDDESGLFFLGDNVMKELFRLTNFDVDTGALIESTPQGGANPRSGAIRMHPHFNWLIFGNDIMSRSGPMFYELDNYPATSLTLAALQDMGIETDPFFARDTRYHDELSSAKSIAPTMTLGCGASL